MTDSTLDSAWQIVKLGFNDNSNQDESSGEYLSERFNIDGNDLVDTYANGLFQDEDINEATHEFIIIAFLLGFEFGKIHEQYIRDMNSL